MRIESQQNISKGEVVDGAIVIGGIAAFIAARNGIRGGYNEAQRQYEEMKESLPEGSKIERTRTILSQLNYRLIAVEAGKGAIDGFRRIIDGPDKKPESTNIKHYSPRAQKRDLLDLAA